MRSKSEKYPIVTLSAVAVAALALVAVPAYAGTNVFTDTYYTTANDNNLNLGIGARTSGDAGVTSYNDYPGGWQSQLRSSNGGELMLAPRNGPGQPRVWAGPDHDFAPDLGAEYTIIFDVNPNAYSNAWAGFTFGANAANQGANVTGNHGGLSVRLWGTDGSWEIFDGTDSSAAAVASGTKAATGYRTVLLDVTDSNTSVTVELSIDGVFQTNYTYTGSFAGNYMAFSAYTDRTDTHSSANFDNLSITTIPNPVIDGASTALVWDNELAGTMVGTLSMAGAEVGETYSYSFDNTLAGNSNASFTISGTNLKTAASLSVGDYPISIIGTDTGAAAFTNQSIVVTVGPPWTSPDLTAAVWFDAADASTISAIGSDVDTWFDKSGNNNNATESTTAKKPSTGTRSIKGLNALDFDGADDRMLFANVACYEKAIFVVFVPDTTAPSPAQQVLGGNALNNQFRLLQGGLQYASADSVYSGFLHSPTTIGANEPAVSGMVFGTSDLTVGFNADYATGGTKNAFTNGDQYGQIGARGNLAAGENFFDGAIGEIVIIDRVPSTDERQEIEGYLANKWRLRRELPDDHPYYLPPAGTVISVR